MAPTKKSEFCISQNCYFFKLLWTPLFISISGTCSKSLPDTNMCTYKRLRWAKLTLTNNFVRKETVGVIIEKLKKCFVINNAGPHIGTNDFESYDFVTPHSKVNLWWTFQKSLIFLIGNTCKKLSNACWTNCNQKL